MIQICIISLGAYRDYQAGGVNLPNNQPGSTWFSASTP